MAQTIAYTVGNGVYLNLTNACTCDCDFCERNTRNGVGSANSLWLTTEPSVEEALQALSAYDLRTADELVFCGFGEPTLRLDAILSIARTVKSTHPTLPIRINTNGHASLIAGKDITPQLAGVIDRLSISLNRPDATSYATHMHPQNGEAAFQALLDFTANAKAHVPSVVLTVVDVLTPDELQQCQTLAKNLNVPLRIRPLH